MSELATFQPKATATALVPNTIADALQLAEFMSKAKLVPEHLRGSPGDCYLVVSQAQRWGLDALAVAQCTSVVRGKLCYEGKLVAAVLYSLGALDGRLTHEFIGKKGTDSYGIRITGRLRGATADSVLEGTVKEWRTYGKDGNKTAWDSVVDDMLVYRGTRQWARRYAPEVMLGVYTPDEMEAAAPEIVSQVADDLMPKAKAKADPEPVDAEFSDVDDRVVDRGNVPALDLPENAVKLLERTAQRVGLTMDDLLAQHGAINMTNLNDVMAALRAANNA